MLGDGGSGVQPVVHVGLRELKKARTRAQVLDAAARLFPERGFDRVTVEEICAAAEISPRTFFRYFHSKDELVFADIEERLDLLLGQLRAEPDDAEPLAVLERAVLALAQEMERRPDALAWAYQLLKDSPALAPTNLRVLRAWEDDLVEEVSRRMRGAEDGPMPTLFGARLAVGEALAAVRIAAEAWVEGVAPGPSVTVGRALECLFAGLRSDLRLGLAVGAGAPERRGADGTAPRSARDTAAGPGTTPATGC